MAQESRGGWGGGGVEHADRKAAPRRGKLNTSFKAKDDSTAYQMEARAAYRDADAQTVEVGPNERKLNWWAKKGRNSFGTRLALDECARDLLNRILFSTHI